MAELKALECLILRGCSLITDEGLRAVAELKCLTVLDLDGCSLVMDVGVRAVAGLPHLTELYPYNTSVTDAGLQHLTSLRNLSHLNLNYCNTSATAEEALRQQIPGLEIVHEREDEDEDEDEEAELSGSAPRAHSCHVETIATPPYRTAIVRTTSQGEVKVAASLLTAGGLGFTHHGLLLRRSRAGPSRRYFTNSFRSSTVCTHKWNDALSQ